MTGYLSGKQNGLVVAGDLIKKPADLIGKSVGVQRGSGANYHLAWFLQHNDIPVDKLSIKYLDAPDQIPAMARDDIQAFFSWEPFLTKAVETVPKAKIFSRTIDDGFVFAGNVAMREDMAKNHKDIAVKVVKGIIAAADWMMANPMKLRRQRTRCFARRPWSSSVRRFSTWTGQAPSPGKSTIRSCASPSGAPELD